MRSPFGPIILLLLLLLPSQSLAQGPATSFDQLTVLIETGDRITVRDESGIETTGRLASLSAHNLTILSDGRRIEWTDLEVSRVLERRQDSLANGALWGLVGGAGGLAILAALVCAAEDCDADPTLILAVGVYGGIGAAIGVGIDAMITRRQVIYSRPSSGAAVSLVPILSRDKRGVALSLRF